MSEIPSPVNVGLSGAKMYKESFKLATVLFLLAGQ